MKAKLYFTILFFIFFVSSSYSASIQQFVSLNKERQLLKEKTKKYLSQNVPSLRAEQIGQITEQVRPKILTSFNENMVGQLQQYISASLVNDSMLVLEYRISKSGFNSLSKNIKAKLSNFNYSFVADLEQSIDFPDFMKKFEDKILIFLNIKYQVNCYKLLFPEYDFRPLENLLKADEDLIIETKNAIKAIHVNDDHTYNLEAFSKKNLLQTQIIINPHLEFSIRNQKFSLPAGDHIQYTYVPQPLKVENLGKKGARMSLDPLDEIKSASYSTTYKINLNSNNDYILLGAISRQQLSINVRYMYDPQIPIKEILLRDAQNNMLLTIKTLTGQSVAEDISNSLVQKANEIYSYSLKNISKPYKQITYTLETSEKKQYEKSYYYDKNGKWISAKSPGSYAMQIKDKYIYYDRLSDKQEKYKLLIFNIPKVNYIFNDCTPFNFMYLQPEYLQTKYLKPLDKSVFTQSTAGQFAQYPDHYKTKIIKFIGTSDQGDQLLASITVIEPFSIPFIYNVNKFSFRVIKYVQ